MIEFVKRLSIKQIADFFDGVGEIKEIRPSVHRGMLDVIFFSDKGKSFWYSISDDFISAYGYDKTSEDWKFYMYEIFGKEYLEGCAEEPVENSFINRLSVKDVEQLLLECRIVSHSIEEKKAFRIGTRRFKVNVDVPVKNELEVVIGPHIDFCNGIPSLNEKTFMHFFSKKFGMDFINYYIEMEKRMTKHKIEKYREKCEQRVKEKLDYMVKTMENESKEDN